mmetsp:Transcript_33691/g.57091  ORF Transcript_33691/g.57091 Transcript_33691/m.57091 type:complete len:175 (+) Transcript_33691:604-1128(+)
MSRAERMKRDLRYFLGADWKSDIKSMPVSVREYVAYIEEVSRERPICLLPYVYHNWMAILAGGQIIRRLATHGMSLPHGKGVSMFAFDGETRASLKRRFKDSVCSIKLDAETRKQVLDESTKVFVQNNSVIRMARMRISTLAQAKAICKCGTMLAGVVAGTIILIAGVAHIVIS